jgi:hypothetical protein
MLDSQFNFYYYYYYLLIGIKEKLCPIVLGSQSDFYNYYLIREIKEKAK